MKIAPLLVILYIALVGVMIFDNTIQSQWNEDPYSSSDRIQYTDSNGSSINPNSIWNLFYEPFKWSTNSFFVWLFSNIIITIGAIVAGALTKSDIALLAPIFVILINAGIVPMVVIYNVVHREIWSMACTGSVNAAYSVAQLQSSCAGDGTITAGFLSAIIIGPLAIAWFLACLGWWTQRPTS